MLVPASLLRVLALATMSLILGGVVDTARAASFDVTRPSTKDSFVRPGQRSRNEGANAILPLRRAAITRIVAGFDLGGIAPATVSKATLKLTVKKNRGGWESGGGALEAHPLRADFAEGNGADYGVTGPGTRGTGAGVTWNCAIDTDISDSSSQCSPRWNGGTFGAATAPATLLANGQTGDLAWDVTQDVLAGNTAWLIQKTVEHSGGRVDFYSREGAIAAGHPEWAPRLELAGCKSDPEICNGVDDDCDGTIDDGNPGGGQSCTLQNPGACVTGETVCRDGAIACDAVPANDGGSCNDGDACTLVDTCSAGRCVGGAAISCDDANPCTSDSCNAQTGCVYTNLGPETVCGASTGAACDAADTCDGAGHCVDRVAPDTTSCGGASQGGACDDDAGDHCSGTDKTCVDAFAPFGTTCRTAAGACDVAEICTGGSGACPANTVARSGEVCRAAVSVCDVAETCNGVSANCPPDEVEQNVSIVCRAAAGDCDRAERCDGVSPECPTDAVKGTNVICRATLDRCDEDEHCDGASKQCPPDLARPAGFPCREAAGACDVAEVCDGTTHCPADAFKPSSEVCRAANGDCDVAETCSGASAACPKDDYVASGQLCRAKNGACDVAERCNGLSPACPDDALALPGVQCRAAAGACDLAEVCNGSSRDCPADGFKDAGVVCRESAGLCDVAESCSGTSADCPADGFVAAGTTCRTQSGVCDIADTCSGTGPDCADAVLPDTTVCFNGGACDPDLRCTGSSRDCPLPVRLGNKVCRPADPTKLCDVAETCGTFTENPGPGCPPDEAAPAGTVCRPDTSGALCEAPEVCDGSSFDCPTANAVKPAGAVCQAAGSCNSQVTCDGSSPICTIPFADWLSFRGNVCGTDTEQCHEPDKTCGRLGQCLSRNKPNGTSCSIDDNGRTVGGTCQSGSCVEVACDKYNLECPDGFRCNGSQCLPVDAGQSGAACTGGVTSGDGSCGSGLQCCAGMQGDGNGGPASSGQSGRCAECCTDISGPGVTPGTEGTCANPQLQCCDGRCVNTDVNRNHCGSCAYAPGGVDCTDSVNACSPATSCQFGGCLYSNACGSGNDCLLPITNDPAPACADSCDEAYQTCVARCASGDAACVGGCDLDQYSCLSRCPFDVPAECKTAPYTGCDETCRPSSGSCYNSGSICHADSDCCTGHCDSGCGGSVSALNCSAPSFCR